MPLNGSIGKESRWRFRFKGSETSSTILPLLMKRAEARQLVHSVL
jgi:hypothetical protein